MVNPSTAIDIKKEKLARELKKDNPNKIIVHRLKESIRRHEKEMKRHSAWRKRENRRKGRWK